MATLDLTIDQLLTTTRSVRKRLELDRPVPRELIRECLELAVQAPTGSNLQSWGFVVVTDAGKRKALADMWKRGYEIYKTLPLAVHNAGYPTAEQEAARARIIDSVGYLAENLHRVPVHVIPCISPRTDDANILVQSAVWGSLIPASWSFMLAARSRGLATCWTNLHQFFEKEAAEILGIPYGEVMQGALIATAYSKGTSYKPAPRDLERVVHWDAW